MKKTRTFLGIIAILAMIGFGLTACEPEPDPDPCASCLKIGATGEGGGKIFYHNHAGFTVTGAGSFTAYYLEAAPTNQATGISWSSTDVDVTGATGTAIGTGKSNTAAIIAAHSGDTASNNAAKAAAAYTGGGKNDWFLPSSDELVAMYEAKSQLDISSSNNFWSSSQYSSTRAWTMDFWGIRPHDFKYSNVYKVRAVRAF